MPKVRRFPRLARPVQRFPRYEPNVEGLLQKNLIHIYADERMARALDELTDGMAVYKCARLSQLLEASYQRGMKDAA